MIETRRLDIGFWFPRPRRGSRLAEELRENGHRVTIYHSKPVPGDQRYVKQVPYNLWRGLKVLLKSDHEIYYTSGSFLPIFQLCINKCVTGRPYVYTLNSPIWVYYDERNSFYFQSLMAVLIYPVVLRCVLAKAEAIVTNSIFLSELLKRKFSPYCAKVKPIYNGIDFGLIQSGVTKPDAWPRGQIRILSVVTLNYDRKTDGVILLLRAFEIIAKNMPEAVFFIAAKSTNREEIMKVQKYIECSAYAACIRIGRNRQDVSDLLATADIFVYATPPDSSDSLPRALLEAQAAGVPTVATQTVGCPEAVSNGVTGRIVSYDAEALAHATLEIIKNREEAIAMAKVGQEIVQKKFAWRKMAAEYEKLFMEGVRKR